MTNSFLDKAGLSYLWQKITALVNTKQNALTFDSAPIANSGNPVTSGGIKTALDGKQGILTFDESPEVNSTNPVTSAGIKSHVDNAFRPLLRNQSQFKNLFAITPAFLDIDYYGLTYHQNLDGSYSLNGTASAMATGKNYVITWLFGADNFQDSVLPAGTYYFSLTDMVGMSFITIKYVYGEDDTASSTTIVSHNSTSAKITFTERAHVFVQISKDKAFNNASFKCQIEQCDSSASAPSEYERPSMLLDYSVRSAINSGYKAFPEKVAYASYRCQGGCLANNKYTWLLYNSSGSVVMHSLDIFTGVHNGSTLPSGTDTSTLYHCNDLTYNPNTKKYMVATLLSSGPIVRLTNNFVYEATIKPRDANNNIITASGVAYDRIHDQYIIAGDDDFNFYVYDSSWTYIKTITPDTTELTVLQGIETDGYYIYRARTDAASASEIPHPHIRTYDMNGHFIEEYTIEQIAGEEIEGLAYDWDSGAFFINTNTKSTAQTNVYLGLPNSMGYHAVDLMMYKLRRLLSFRNGC